MMLLAGVAHKPVPETLIVMFIGGVLFACLALLIYRAACSAGSKAWAWGVADPGFRKGYQIGFGVAVLVCSPIILEPQFSWAPFSQYPSVSFGLAIRDHDLFSAHWHSIKPWAGGPQGAIEATIFGRLIVAKYWGEPLAPAPVPVPEGGLPPLPDGEVIEPLFMPAPAGEKTKTIRQPDREA